MKIGVPKEIKNHEYRVGLTPPSVAELVAAGHEVCRCEWLAASSRKLLRCPGHARCWQRKERTDRRRLSPSDLLVGETPADGASYSGAGIIAGCKPIKY